MRRYNPSKQPHTLYNGLRQQRQQDRRATPWKAVSQKVTLGATSSTPRAVCIPYWLRIDLSPRSGLLLLISHGLSEKGGKSVADHANTPALHALHACATARHRFAKLSLSLNMQLCRHRSSSSQWGMRMAPKNTESPC
jgi:hypothetical protein